MYELTDVRAASRLVQWSLRPLARPTNSPAYRELLARYTSSFSFRDLVNGIAEELGLQVLDVGSLGIATTPTEQSIFTFTSNDIQPNGTADDHLLNGLILIAIQATIYPLAQDLADDPTIVREAITAENVDTTLRVLCDRLETQARDQADPTVESVEERLHAAYLVYKARPQTRVAKNGRMTASATLAMIEHMLQLLQSQGFFLLKTRNAVKSYSPTWRFQVQVQNWTATQLYATVKTLLTQETKDK